MVSAVAWPVEDDVDEGGERWISNSEQAFRLAQHNDTDVIRSTNTKRTRSAARRLFRHVRIYYSVGTYVQKATQIKPGQDFGSSDLV